MRQPKRNPDRWEEEGKLENAGIRQWQGGCLISIPPTYEGNPGQAFLNPQSSNERWLRKPST